MLPGTHECRSRSIIFLLVLLEFEVFLLLVIFLPSLGFELVYQAFVVELFGRLQQTGGSEHYHDQYLEQPVFGIPEAYQHWKFRWKFRRLSEARCTEQYVEHLIGADGA